MNMFEEFDMRIDIYSALKDFLDAYDNHAEMVVTEAVANALDVNATKIDIILKNDVTNKKTIIFYNNGPPMSKEQFDNYHVLARSSKSKGQGIGFAGIGAKVYLAAWDKTIIHTETTDGKNGIGSDMWVKNNTLKAKFIEKITLKKPGTQYSVSLESDDYNYLDKMLEDTVIDTFTPALVTNTTVTINGKKLKAWMPNYKLKKNIQVKIKDKKFPIILTVTKDDIPIKKRGIQYHVLGKVITTKRPEWFLDVMPIYQSRIHAYVNSTDMSEYLNLNKTTFKSGTGKIFNEINKKIFDTLSKEGYILKESVSQTESTNFTRFLDKLFRNPKYAFLNPNARGGKGPGQGDGKGGSGQSKSNGSSKNKDKQNKSNNEPRGGGALKTTYVMRPHDKREGWIDASTNNIVINGEHPLLILVENNKLARNQRLGAIITSVLIKNANSKKSMIPEEAFTLQTEILTMAKDIEWKVNKNE